MSLASPQSLCQSDAAMPTQSPRPRRLLAIETSCDETAAAVTEECQTEALSLDADNSMLRFVVRGIPAVGFFAQVMQAAWGMWFSEVIVLLGLSVIGYQLLGFRPLRAMGLQRFDGRAFGLGFAFGLLNYVAWAVPLIALTEVVFPKQMLDVFAKRRVLGGLQNLGPGDPAGDRVEDFGAERLGDA